MGGADQWGNMTAGLDLVHKLKENNENATTTSKGESESSAVHALTLPLLLTSSGAKFGKSEGNAIWLDPLFTSPFEFYQARIEMNHPFCIYSPPHYLILF